jgi:kanamycin nucleotidyltransferase
MEAGPQPMAHQRREELARAIAERLLKRYGAGVKAIGIYGSLARGEDGPFSDIEMICVLRGVTEEHTYEWCAGPWKAEVNVLDEPTLQREAAELEGRWALTQGAFVDLRPLIDPEDCFGGLRALVMSHSPAAFRMVIEEVLIGDIYELIGKTRNARSAGRFHALPVLAVELARRTAMVLGLEHRHLYGTGSYVLEQAITLPSPPDGWLPLAEMIMRGDLRDHEGIAAACDALWAGLARWAEARGYTIVASREIPI